MDRISKIALTIIAGLALAGEANASLSLFQRFVGTVEKSTDGCGSTTQTCELTASVPVGSTVLGVYLYSSAFNQNDFGSGPPAPAGTLRLNDGSTNPTTNYGGVSQVALGPSVGGGGVLQAYRNDLTSFFAPLITGSASPLSFTVTETMDIQDGEALVIVYSNPTLPTSTAFIYDGFTDPTGDGFSFTLATGFSGGDLRIGDGYSSDGTDPSNPTNTSQVSTITVGSSILTNVAGHCDDAEDVSCANGNLITVGGWNDPASPLNPTVDRDHERYNLGLLLNNGETTVNIHFINPSTDDNIFLAVFDFAGIATVTTVPEPASFALLAVGLAGLGLFSRGIVHDRSRSGCNPDRNV
jgi:hypothetical protein